MKGWDEATCKSEWLKLIIDPKVKKVAYNGETLIVKFAGIAFNEYSKSGSAVRTKAEGKASTNGELDRWKEKGASLLKHQQQLGKRWMEPES